MGFRVSGLRGSSVKDPTPKHEKRTTSPNAQMPKILPSECSRGFAGNTYVLPVNIPYIVSYPGVSRMMFFFFLPWISPFNSAAAWLFKPCSTAEVPTFMTPSAVWPHRWVGGEGRDELKLAMRATYSGNHFA